MGGMGSLTKLLLAVVGLVIVLAVAAALAVALLVDPNDYRDEIANAVEQQTGRQLSINGELSLKLLPCCAIGIADTSLSNPPGFAGENFVSVDDVRLGLQVWPLISRQELLLGKVTLSGLDLSLQRNADGLANWEFTGQDEVSDTKSDATSDAAEPTESGDAPALKTLSVAGVSITDARISLRDEVTDLDLLVDELELVTGAIEPGQPFDVRGSFELDDRQTGTELELALSANAAVDIATQVTQLAGFAAEVEIETADDSELDATLNADLLSIDAGSELAVEVQQLGASEPGQGRPRS